MAGLLVVGNPGAASAQALQSNSQKYRERNPSAATGRAGSATLAGRLLLAKDGTTDAEVTTGELDSSATPPGTLSKIQLKAFDADGETMFTRNFTPATASGYWKETFTALAPAQPFQIQANVRGIDGKRTDVVVVTDSVRKRPDLTVRKVQAPGQATVGTTVQIVASVAELNGQVGAHGDCVLYVDDIEVDRTSGIWVDSNDAVSCAFAQAFSTAGTREIEVHVSNVRPGDWDESNNSAEAVLEVVSPTEAYNYAYAYAQTLDNYRAYYKYSGKYRNSTSSSGQDWLDEQNTTSADGYDYFYYYGERWTDVPYASNVSLTLSATDGTTSWNGGSPATPGCWTSGSAVINGRTIYWWGYACGYAQIQMYSYAGSITYVGYSYRRYFQNQGLASDYDTPTEWFWNYTQEFGPTRISGAAVTIDAVLTADDKSYSLPLTVSLSTPVTYSDRYSWCSTYTNWDGSYTEYCYEWDYSYDYRGGQNFVYNP